MQHVAPMAAAIRSRPPPTAVIMTAFVLTEEEFDPSVLTLDPSVTTEEEVGSGVGTGELGAGGVETGVGTGELGAGVGTGEIGTGVGLSDGQLEAFAHEMAAVRCKWYGAERRGPVTFGLTNKASECGARYNTSTEIGTSTYSIRQTVLRRNLLETPMADEW